MPHGPGPLFAVMSRERAKPHTGTRDVTERMSDILERHGFRVAVMKADAVAPDRREAWVAERVKEGIDRSWRIGQTRPVRVVFMAYRNSLQADALKLVAKKLQSSLAVAGELPEDGLAAYGDDGDDLMLALARKIGNGEEEDEETVEAAFAQARDAEAVAEELLVDEGWRTFEVEPEIVEADNGANGAGAAVEVVMANGHLPAEEPNEAKADEPEQAVLTWAELFAEVPAKRNGRRRKPPQPASLSLFEWAVNAEEEREEELVGAGR